MYNKSVFSSCTITSVSTYLGKKSLFMKDKETILVFGGIDPNTNFGVGCNTGKNIFRYHIGQNAWKPVGEMPVARYNHNVIFLLGKIFLVGELLLKNCIFFLIILF